MHPPRPATPHGGNAALNLARSTRQAARNTRRKAGRLARKLGVYPTLASARSWVGDRLKTLTPVESDFDGITVIIPTYRPNQYIDQAIGSVLHQDLPAWTVDVIVCVNGPDVAHYEALQRRYRLNPRVRVIHTSRPGLSAGRNFALQHVRRELFTYLDDDDYFTEGYLREMLSAMTPEVELVCGRLEDEFDGVRNTDTYINRASETLGKERLVSDYVKAASLLSSAWAKLYRTDFAKNRYGAFDESVTHTEDVLFWVDNIDKLTLPLAVVPIDSREALIRQVTEGSMSRPSDERAYGFWITGRLDVLRRLELRIFQPGLALEHKRYIMVKLDSQCEHLKRYFATLTGKLREQARTEILAAGLALLNTSFLTERRGIAFCHNFAPFQDASAYVAAKRLPQIADLVGEPIAWQVISADMSRMRGRDWTFGQFYARHQYQQLTQLSGQAYFNPKAQHQWATRALEVADNEQVDVIYSRSMFAGSHEAAYRYKERHPQVIWYAEFSDPVYLDTTGDQRAEPTVHTGGDEWLNDYWKTIENWVYQAADSVIFTNPNQRRVMLEHAEADLVERAWQHSSVLTHPVLNSRWSNLVPADYELDPENINVGYFGSFYPNRSADQLLTLLDDPRVHLHLFVPNPSDVGGDLSERLHVNRAVDHLAFLSIGRRMDYLVLNDIKYAGPVNPYIPSKLADYIATGTTVLAFVEPGSILSEYESEQVVKLNPGDRVPLERVWRGALL